MDKALNELETCLRQMIEEHQKLLATIGRKQQAMRAAKPGDVQECCKQENVHVQRIGEVEKQRQLVVGRLTALISPAAKEPLSIVEIADRASEARRGRLLVLRQQLRELMQKVQRENAIARDVTDGLLRHVQGVIQQVAAAMGVGTYGRRGSVPQSNAMASTFSVTG